ncbi:hypothetical protein [Altererythrobacter sp. ZODW24]|uniref:hypothetical protein n=1 Tax=Altererythrobacter sp. ZODW24 TaxID=2185142 RepID=UPI000DF84CAF|nr:hypothetical protein [Altererythrobacter sp. ZODW24]
MTTIQRSLLIASAMLLTAVLAIFDIIPAAFAEHAPLFWLVFVPWTLAGQRSACRLTGAKQ